MKIEANMETQLLHIIYIGLSSSFLTSPAIPSSDGRDVQAVLTVQMSSRRHVGGLHIFPIDGVRFNLQDIRFIPTYFATLIFQKIKKIKISLTCVRRRPLWNEAKGLPIAPNIACRKY
jgi:hypothetical protein